MENNEGRSFSGKIKQNKTFFWPHYIWPVFIKSFSGIMHHVEDGCTFLVQKNVFLLIFRPSKIQCDSHLLVSKQ